MKIEYVLVAIIVLQLMLPVIGYAIYFFIDRAIVRIAMWQFKNGPHL